MVMHVTCQSCDTHYAVPAELVGDGGRRMRCGECGSRWWQDAGAMAGAGVAVAEKPASRTLVVQRNGQWQEESSHRFTSFFDNVSNRFSAQDFDAADHSSQRFQRLKTGRQQRRLREENAIVEAEYREIRDWRGGIEKIKYWLPRAGVVGLMAASILIVIFVE